MTHSTPPPRARRAQHGLTLIELMVSVLLASILSGGLFYLLSGQSKTYQNQFNTLSVQENLWGAMEFLQRQVRLAGYGMSGCPSGGSLVITPSGTSWTAFKHYNNCDIRQATAGACTNNSACACSGTGSASGTDSFAVTYADPANAIAAGLSSVRITSMAGQSNNFFVKDKGNLVACDLVALWQPGSSTNNCTLLMITDIQAQGNKFKLTHDTSGCTGAATYNSPPPIGSIYNVGSLVTRIGGTNSAGPRYFAIDTSVNPSRLITWVTTAVQPNSDWANNSFEVIADGIEDLQISWACDANDDGRLVEGATPAARQSDEWFHNTATDVDPTCTTHSAKAVRITLVATSGEQSGNAVPNARPLAEDHAAGSKTRHVRARLSLTVRPRNIR